MSEDADGLNCTGFEGRVPEAWNGITRRIIGAAIEVHRHLEPGMPEVIYERALMSEMRRQGLCAIQQARFDVRYKDESVGQQILDLVVEDHVAVELKAVEAVSDLHLAQLMGYLHASGLPLGLLINFNVPLLKDGVFRRINVRSPRLNARQSRSAAL